MLLTEAVRRLEPLPSPLPPPMRAIEPRLLLRRGPDRVPARAQDAGPPSTRHAAGLLLLFPDSRGEARVLLTERPTQLRHGGQVSLPGGRREPADDFPTGTALREAAEEVGLDPVAARVRVVGLLDVVDVRVSGFLLTPVLAVAERQPRVVPDPSEVAAVLTPPVDIFLPDATVTMAELVRDGLRIRYGGYPWEGRHVWGATARVLSQLGATLDAGASSHADVP